jgi:hypothetical protein
MRAIVYLWFKRFLILAWLVATTIFTIDANEVEGIKNDYLADFIAAILVFNLIPWLVINRKRKKRKKASRKITDDAEVYDPRKSTTYILISLVVIVGAAAGIYVWADKQVANLAESPTATFIDTYEKGAADPKIAWTQVTERNAIPMTWHTCKKIKVFVNPGEVKSAVDDVKQVIDQVNQLTSLNFYYAGLSEQQAFVDMRNEREVLIGFYSEQDAPTPAKFGKAIGIASGQPSFTAITSGNIGIRTPAYNKANKKLRQQVLLHEFGHVLGLDHVTTKKDVMYPEAYGTKIDFNQETKAYFLAHPGCEKK